MCMGVHVHGYVHVYRSLETLDGGRSCVCRGSIGRERRRAWVGGSVRVQGTGRRVQGTGSVDAWVGGSVRVRVRVGVRVRCEGVGEGEAEG